MLYPVELQTQGNRRFSYRLQTLGEAVLRSRQVRQHDVVVSAGLSGRELCRQEQLDRVERGDEFATREQLLQIAAIIQRFVV